jgi:MATE family multidrug resistance protein
MGVRGSALSTVIARILMALSLMGFAWRYERKRGHPLFKHWAGPQLDRIRNSSASACPPPARSRSKSAHGTQPRSPPDGSTPDRAGHAPDRHQLRQHHLHGPARNLSRSRGQRRPRRRRRRQSARPPRRLAGARPRHQLHDARRHRLLHRAQAADRALHARPARAGRRPKPASGLPPPFRSSTASRPSAPEHLRGLGETRAPMFANFIGYWILGLPLGLILCFVLKWGIYGMWIGLTLALIVISSTLLHRWQSTYCPPYASRSPQSNSSPDQAQH